MAVPFRFYSLTEEDKVVLRGNTRRCVALLRPCKPLADKLALAGGVSAPLTQDDERLLQGFHIVQQAHEGYVYEGRFDELCGQAGLLPSDAGLLTGRVQTLYRQREPALYEAEAYALIHQWLRDKDQDTELPEA